MKIKHCFLILLSIAAGILIGSFAGSRIARSNSFYEMVKFNNWDMKETVSVEIKTSNGKTEHVREKDYPFFLSSSFKTLPLKKSGKHTVEDWKYRIVLDEKNASNVPSVEILIGDEGLSVDGVLYTTFNGTPFSVILQYFDNTFSAPSYKMLY